MGPVGEDDSLATLVADLDDSFWDATLTPDNSPRKPKNSFTYSIPVKPQRSPLKKTTINTNDNIDASYIWHDVKDSVKLSDPSALKGNSSHSRFKRIRCIVESVDELFSDGRYQKILTVSANPEQDSRTVTLRDDWTHTDIKPGDTIHIIGSFLQPHPSSLDSKPSIIIDSKDNFIILHPDLLITITAVSTASQCLRKPLLSGLVRSSTDYTPALVWGNMLHEVMQTCLSENKWESSYIDQQIELVLSKGLMDLVRINTTIGEARRELHERSRGLPAFAAKYLSQLPKPEAVLKNTRDTATDAPSLLAIADVLDIEEDIWSPSYGLRGKLDVTVFAHTAATNKSARTHKIELLNSCPTPFEIKTGRANAGMEHRAQTMLYTLLAEERYASNVPAGLLYYTQSEEVVRVPRSRNEVRALITTRNQLASWMMKRIRAGRAGEADEEEDITSVTTQNAKGIVELEESFLPPTIDDERTCKRCYVLDTCMLYRKAVENVIDNDSHIVDTYKAKTSHLTASHCDFFKKWEALLSYEERDIIRFKKELWTLRAEERERKGRCFAEMILDTTFDPSSEAAEQNTLPQTGFAAGDDVDTLTNTSAANVAKIHKQTYRFTRSPTHRIATEFSVNPSLLNGHINVGDAVTISVEPHLLALARGYVLKLTATSVVIGVDHDLSPGSIKAKLSYTSGYQDDNEALIFRIDRDELFGGMSRMRNNLAHLFYVDNEDGKIGRLRELVVDLKAPLFHNDVPPQAKKLLRKLLGLNQPQIDALRKIISAQDYALVLGMPGTGKTTVITALICILVQLGKTVLLTSYTHSAVDTILLKLDAIGNINSNSAKGMCDFGVLRLGNVDKVHPQVRKYTLAARTPAQTIEQLEGQLMTPPVVATTCLSIDQCVRNPAARAGGLDVSLFRLLSDAHPKAIIELAHQYRMNKDIMLLSNKLVYGDRLRCGNKKVAKQSLDIADWSFANRLHGAAEQGCIAREDGACWIRRLLSPSTKAVFVDTDLVPARDSRAGDLVQNKVEAELVYQTVESLLQSGVREDQIGIISLYRQQIKLISQLLRHRTGIEILTADRSQGRDKECIIISMVRSNDAGHTGDLVKDWRRMNVSFTRARCKLAIFGSRSTLQQVQLLDDFFQLMQGNGWILQLPPGAEAAHLHKPLKRLAEDDEGEVESRGKENVSLEENRARKKLKMGGTSRSVAGILKGRPILQDLVNEEA
ncbi:DNA replication factor Dna2-domain-containing protein [Amanita rubescens]|nr:DNA replication factor Dna2-domain-containing protein [Amanita rubescens]